MGGLRRLVVVNGAEVHSGGGFGTGQYLWTRLQLINPGNIRIGLVVPATSVSLDGYIFDVTSAADFIFTAYSLTGQVIYQQSWNAGSGTGFSHATGPLPQPAYFLHFSNAGRHDVGIDNLALTPIPPPGPVCWRWPAVPLSAACVAAGPCKGPIEGQAPH